MPLAATAPASSPAAALAPEQELERVRAEAAAAAPPPPAEPSKNAELAGELSRLAEGLEAEDPASLALIAALSEEDLVDVLQLGFALVALKRGEHWNLPDAEAKPIAKWAYKSIQRHGLAWVAKWLPDIMTGALLAWAILGRMDRDKQLAKGEPTTKAA